MAHPKDPLKFPPQYFDYLSAARHNTWQDMISTDRYSRCREKQSRWAGFRQALLNASTHPRNDAVQQASFTELHRLSLGIKASITRHTDGLNATLTYTFLSTANVLAALMTPPANANPSATQRAISDAIAHGTGATLVHPNGTVDHIPATHNTMYDNVNPTEDEYEKHRLTDLRNHRKDLHDRIVKALLCYQITHPALMGNPSISFEPTALLDTVRWMAANTDYSPSMDAAEALTDLLVFNTDNPNLSYA